MEHESSRDVTQETRVTHDTGKPSRDVTPETRETNDGGGAESEMVHKRQE